MDQGDEKTCSMRARSSCRTVGKKFRLCRGDHRGAGCGSGYRGAQAVTIDVQHELGTTTVPINPKQVVVFDFGVLDSLDTLGIDVIGLPKGTVPAYLSKYAADKYVNVGTLQEPDFEVINALKPDLIIISGRHIRSLRRAVEARADDLHGR